MKLSEYIKNLQLFEKRYGDLEVIYSKDDEGNGYHKVNYTPSAFQIEDLNEYYLEVIGQEGEEGINVNAICIN